MLIVALGGTEDTATTAVALVMAGAGAIAYIVAEGLTDAANTTIEALPIEVEAVVEETE